MLGHAQGELLAQVQPGVTTAVNLFTAGDVRMEITLVLACQKSGGTGSPVFELFHDDDGTTYNDTTIIYNDTLNSGTNRPTVIAMQAQHSGSGVMIKPGGSLGCRSSIASEITFSVYGHSASIAERVKGEI